MAIQPLLIAVLASHFFWLTRSKAAVAPAGLAIAGALVANYSVVETHATVTLSEICSYQNKLPLIHTRKFIAACLLSCPFRFPLKSALTKSTNLSDCCGNFAVSKCRTR